MAFEKSLKELKNAMDLVKEFDGLDPIDVDAEANRRPVQEVGQRMLQMMIGTMPLPMQAAVTQANIHTEWKDTGLSITCSLIVSGQSVDLNQVIPYDARDIKHQQIGLEMGERYHTIKERLASLAQCSTGDELSACVECFPCQGEEGMCVVCQDDLNPGDPGMRIKACGHTFHEECVKGWLLGCKRECPSCRVPLDAHQNVSEEISEPELERDFELGARVTLTGLLSRTELNGLTGKILEPMNDRGRYLVGLDDGLQLRAKTCNLRPSTPVRMGFTDSDRVGAESNDEAEDDLDTLNAAIAMSLQEMPVTVTEDLLGSIQENVRINRLEPHNHQLELPRQRSQQMQME